MQRTIRTFLQQFLLPLSFAVLLASAAALALPQADDSAPPATRHKAARAASAKPMAGMPAPAFETRTLEGKTFDNRSLEGSIALIQFWTTRCLRCAADQQTLEDLDRGFLGQGLVVLAINEGDSPAAVNQYLHEHPTTCRIALDPRKELARRFAVRGYPFYVAIDRRGRIAAEQSGPAGEKAMLSLLATAGLHASEAAAASPGASRERPKAQQASTSGAASPATTAAPAAETSTAPPPPTPPKIIDVPQEANAPEAKPVPRTVFVLTNGERIESDHYTVDADRVHLVVNGRQRTIRTSDLDVKATEAANRDRGVEFKLPTRGREMVIR
jgi:peroxiredoxin